MLLLSDLAIRAETAHLVAPQHYDAARGTVTFETKFGTAQVMPVTESLREMFASIPKDSNPLTPFVWLLHPRKRITVDSLRKSMYTAMRKAGIARRFTPHDLRRTTAGIVYENSGHNLRLVQAVLGHKHLSSTLHYLDHRNTPVPLAALELAKLHPLTEATQ